jgi:hypothetical protein
MPELTYPFRTRGTVREQVGSRSDIMTDDARSFEARPAPLKAGEDPQTSWTR